MLDATVVERKVSPTRRRSVRLSEGFSENEDGFPTLDERILVALRTTGSTGKRKPLRAVISRTLSREKNLGLGSKNSNTRLVHVAVVQNARSSRGRLATRTAPEALIRIPHRRTCTHVRLRHRRRTARRTRCRLVCACRCTCCCSLCRCALAATVGRVRSRFFSSKKPLCFAENGEGDARNPIVYPRIVVNGTSLPLSHTCLFVRSTEMMDRRERRRRRDGFPTCAACASAAVGSTCAAQRSSGATGF